MVRSRLPGDRGGEPGGVRLRTVRPVRVPRPSRPVRELAGAAGGDPGGTAGRPRRAGGTLAQRARQRRVCADRPRAAHRAGEQERHPHRGVREGASRARDRGRGGGARSRPAALPTILMTSFAFILGSLPLVFASGAGAASRHSMGTTVVGGMLAVTVLGVLLVPAFYVAVERLAARRRRGEPIRPRRAADGSIEATR